MSTTDLQNTAGEIPAGHVLGRYELLMPIASGGMAMVWAARLKGSRGFQKIVAVKTMLSKLSEDPTFEQMFLDEATHASEIRHPHVVEIMDLGEQDGVLYLVMELVDGVPLNQLMKAAKQKGGIPRPIAVRIVMQALAGLHAAHELKDSNGQLKGLVHRDVSPQNLLVTYEGVTKVVDFGIAKATALGGGATVAGQIKGKVAYMAPEQVKGGDVDRRVDVFAMGIVLYALTTSKHPLRRESEAATMYNICAPEPVMAPSKIVKDYPAELEKVVLLALAKDPSKRYPTANDMLRSLDALPSSMRAGTDEDVGNFVKSLFQERRLERQQALRHALELADQHSQERLLIQVPRASGSVTPVTPVLGLADTGVTSSRVSLVSPDEIQGSITGGNTLDAALLVGPTRKRLVYGAVAGGALLLLGGIILLASSASRGSEAVVIPGPSTVIVHPAAGPDAGRAREPEAAEGQGQRPLDLRTLPEADPETDQSAEPESSPSVPAPTEPRPRPVRPLPLPRNPVTVPENSAASDDWKRDPGF